MKAHRTALLWWTIVAAALVSGAVPAQAWPVAVGAVTVLAVFQRLRHSLFGRDPQPDGP